MRADIQIGDVRRIHLEHRLSDQTVDLYLGIEPFGAGEASAEFSDIAEGLAWDILAWVKPRSWPHSTEGYVVPTPHGWTWFRNNAN